MDADEERCAEARKFQQIHDAFGVGDLDALRSLLGDPLATPEGTMGDLIGPPLVYAIYHSPLSFIRTLLDAGADPNVPVDDGFPPLIAALTTSVEHPGATRRDDVDEILRALLSSGADPNQRGLNDYTPLHLAVEQRNLRAVQLLMEAGADPEQRTRIDDCTTPREMAAAAGLADFSAVLAGDRAALRRRLRSGLTLLSDTPGLGEPVRRQHNYFARLRMWLNKGEPVRWQTASGPVGHARFEDNGETLFTTVRVERRSLINGLFYGMDGMRVGGTRKLEIAPHLAYGEQGVPGVIPPAAVLIVEITVFGEKKGI